jgi:L-iditol 2-dehydrogenase
MATATQSGTKATRTAIAATMTAAVYRGPNDVRIESVPVPEIGPGEVLIRVHTCGICGTDLKKIATGSHSAPRIFGHETAGMIAAVGTGVRGFEVGDRVMAFHHIPCGECYYCRHKVFAQCEVYKRVGCTAGFEPAGGGFAEYVRVMDWIVARGLVKIPENVSCEQASFIEPVNTCMKGIETLRLEPGETVLVMGQGPIGLILAYLAQRAGARVITSDLYAPRLTIAKSLGIAETIDATRTETVERVRELTERRGADAVILAVAANQLVRPALEATRPGGRTMLFAQTVRSEVGIDPAAICVDEKSLVGSYSASVDLQQEAVRFVLGREFDLMRLITHRFPLAQAVEALQLASNPRADSLKVVVQPAAAHPSKPNAGLPGNPAAGREGNT